MLVSRRYILPEIADAIVGPRFERLEVEFKQMLDAFAECLRQGDCRRELPSLRCASDELDGALESIRQSEILNGSHPEAPERVFEVVEYYRATGEALEKCRRLMSELKIHRYWAIAGSRAEPTLSCTNSNSADMTIRKVRSLVLKGIRAPSMHNHLMRRHKQSVTKGWHAICLSRSAINTFRSRSKSTKRDTPKKR
jgi:hypothetical protein